MLTNVKHADCINIHFRPHFCIFMQKCTRVVLHFAASCERPPVYGFKKFQVQAPYLHLIIYRCLCAPPMCDGVSLFLLFFPQ